MIAGRAADLDWPSWPSDCFKSALGPAWGSGWRELAVTAADLDVPIKLQDCFKLALGAAWGAERAGSVGLVQSEIADRFANRCKPIRLTAGDTTPHDLLRARFEKISEHRSGSLIPTDQPVCLRHALHVTISATLSGPAGHLC